jgi:proline iminopeptidase
VEACLADLEAIREDYGIERWIVAGHSSGADLAFAYALHYPERVYGFICIAGGRIHNDREMKGAIFVIRRVTCGR